MKDNPDIIIEIDISAFNEAERQKIKDEIGNNIVFELSIQSINALEQKLIEDLQAKLTQALPAVFQGESRDNSDHTPGPNTTSIQNPSSQIESPDIHKAGHDPLESEHSTAEQHDEHKTIKQDNHDHKDKKKTESTKIKQPSISIDLQKLAQEIMKDVKSKSLISEDKSKSIKLILTEKKDKGEGQTR